MWLNIASEAAVRAHEPHTYRVDITADISDEDVTATYGVRPYSLLWSIDPERTVVSSLGDLPLL